MAALLIPALDCDRKGDFQSCSGRWVWSLGGAIHQVGGGDRNIYCRVLRAARSRRRSGCCPPVSPSVLWLLSKLPRRVGGEVRGGTQKPGVRVCQGSGLGWNPVAAPPGTRMRIFTLAHTAPAAARTGFRLHCTGMDWWRSPLLGK